MIKFLGDIFTMLYCNFFHAIILRNKVDDILNINKRENEVWNKGKLFLYEISLHDENDIGSQQ